jgi:protein SCO1/2
MSWPLRHIVWCALWISFPACSEGNKPAGQASETVDLPILSRKVWNGKDSVYATVRNFSFLNQDSQIVKGTDLKGHLHVADFFFTSCPSICPIMTGNLLKVHEAFRHDPRVLIVSYSIDPEHDSPAVLRAYAAEKNIDTQRWWFLTGPKDSLYAVCTEDYLAYAIPDEKAPGGYLHSGFLILVDENGLIRGAYDGTTESKVEVLIRDIHKLLNQSSHAHR